MPNDYCPTCNAELSDPSHCPSRQGYVSAEQVPIVAQYEVAMSLAHLQDLRDGHATADLEAILDAAKDDTRLGAGAQKEIERAYDALSSSEGRAP